MKSSASHIAFRWIILSGSRYGVGDANWGHYNMTWIRFHARETAEYAGDDEQGTQLYNACKMSSNDEVTLMFAVDACMASTRFRIDLGVGQLV
eukprot:3223077-Amphidinium_carterae.1